MLQRIRLHHFRNLADCDIPLHPGVTLVEGRNGHGKTNFLEALHWVTQGWSFRTRQLPTTIRQGENEAWLQVEGLLENQRTWKQDLLYSPNSIRARTSEGEFSSLTALHGHLWATYLGPQDIALLREGPELRRKWLDVLLTQHYADGVPLLSAYKRILLQRNHFLKMHRGQNSNQLSIEQSLVFETLSTQLATLGARVMLYRQSVLDNVEPYIRDTYAKLAGEQEHIKCFYQSSCHLSMQSSAESIQSFLLEKLQQSKHQEFLIGHTAHGPHKDDVRITFQESGLLLREIGSQGQCRSAALALGLSALNLRPENPPILLLDDVFSELDSERRIALAQQIRGKSAQILVASPRTEDLPFAVDQQLCVYRGDISPHFH